MADKTVSQEEKDREPFKITSADSSGNYLLVYSSNRFMILDISPLLDDSKNLNFNEQKKETNTYHYVTKYQLDLIRTKA